jgi:hypothetical protein
MAQNSARSKRIAWAAARGLGGIGAIPRLRWAGVPPDQLEPLAGAPLPEERSGGSGCGGACPGARRGPRGSPWAPLIAMLPHTRLRRAGGLPAGSRHAACSSRPRARQPRREAAPPCSVRCSGLASRAGLVRLRAAGSPQALGSVPRKGGGGQSETGETACQPAALEQEHCAGIVCGDRGRRAAHGHTEVGRRLRASVACASFCPSPLRGEAGDPPRFEPRWAARPATPPGCRDIRPEASRPNLCPHL